jgi:hypothetical protein
MALQDPIYNPKPAIKAPTNAALGDKLGDPAFQQNALNKINCSYSK